MTPNAVRCGKGGNVPHRAVQRGEGGNDPTTQSDLTHINTPENVVIVADYIQGSEDTTCSSMYGSREGMALTHMTFSAYDC